MARLTIPDEQTSVSFSVTGSTSTFPFDFAIFEKADLVVQVDGVSLDQADFTLTGTLLEGGGYQGGAVVLNDAVEDAAVFIYRDVTPARAENFGAVTSVPVRTVDLALNRQMAVAQDLRRDQSAVLAALPILETLPADVASESYVVAQLGGKADDNLANATSAPDFENAIPRPYIAKAIEFLSDQDYDETGRSDVVALEMALADSADGLVPLKLFKQRVIDQPLIIPDKAVLIGPRPTYDQAFAAAEYGEEGLSLTDDVSITLSHGARLENTRLSLVDLVRPTTPVQAMMARNAMAGTAVISDAIGCDVRNVQIIGFERAIDVTGVGRIRIENNRIDCKHGIRLVESLDTSLIKGNHLWPFLTAGNEGTPGVSGYEPLALTREGIGIELGGAQNDYTNLVDNFTFGQKIGIQLSGASHVRLAGNGCDNNAQAQVLGGPTALAFAQQSIGLNVQGETRNTLVTDFRGSGNGRTVVIQPTGRTPRVEIKGLRSWSPALYHLDHQAGELVAEIAGAETPEGGSFPNGHKIRIGDAITSCELVLRGPDKPVLEASNAALAKTKIAETTVRPEAGAVIRDARETALDRISIKDFGAIGDGASHPLSSITRHSMRDTTGWTLAQWQTVYPFADSLTNEIDWCAHQAAANTGGMIDVPAGRYIMGAKTVTGVATEATNGTDIQGAGLGITFWVFSGTTGDCFNFTTLTGCGISDGTLVTTETRTSGAGVRLADSNDVRSRNMRFSVEGSARWFANYIIDGGPNQYLCRLSGYQCGFAQYGILVGTTSGLVQGLVIGEGVGNKCSEAGIELRNASGIQIFGWGDFIECKHAIKANPGVGQIVTALLIDGFLCDTATLHGCYLTTSGGSVSNISLNGMWAATCGTLGSDFESALCSGLMIDQGSGKIDGVSVVGGEYYNNITSGIAVVAASNVHITGAQVGYNSIGTPGLFAGVYFGPGAVDCSIEGGMSGPYGLFKARDNKPNSQSFGVQIDGATRTVVSGVNVTDNVTGGIQNAGTDSLIANCPGYRTKTSGTAFLPDGATFVDVFMNIDAPLQKERCQLQVFGNATLWPDSVSGQIVRVATAAPVVGGAFFQVNVDQSF